MVNFYEMINWAMLSGADLGGGEAEECKLIQRTGVVFVGLLAAAKYPFGKHHF